MTSQKEKSNHSVHLAYLAYGWGEAHQKHLRDTPCHFCTLNITTENISVFTKEIHQVIPYDDFLSSQTDELFATNVENSLFFTANDTRHCLFDIVQCQKCTTATACPDHAPHINHLKKNNKTIIDVVSDFAALHLARARPYTENFVTTALQSLAYTPDEEAFSFIKKCVLDESAHHSNHPCETLQILREKFHQFENLRNKVINEGGFQTHTSSRKESGKWISDLNPNSDAMHAYRLGASILTTCRFLGLQRVFRGQKIKLTTSPDFQLSASTSMPIFSPRIMVEKQPKLLNMIQDEFNSFHAKNAPAIQTMTVLNPNAKEIIETSTIFPISKNTLLIFYDQKYEAYSESYLRFCCEKRWIHLLGESLPYKKGSFDTINMLLLGANKEKLEQDFQVLVSKQIDFLD